jgi:bis(5'-nucleosyl)-tetraphosphatase (symmetrical)
MSKGMKGHRFKSVTKLDTKRRTFVVGDIHGCLNDLYNLLEYARFREGQDRLVLVGDLVDRGPDSAGVLRFARKLRATVVLGNHEEKHLRYWRHVQLAKADPSYRIPMSMPHPEVHQTLSEEDFEYIARMPLAVYIGKRTAVVHGGFSKDIPCWRPKLNACRVRTVHPVTRKAVPTVGGFAPHDGSVYWTQLYRGKRNVIYGHEARREVAWTKRSDGVWTLGLDTGCVYGNKLSGVWVGTGEVVSVPSRFKPLYRSVV